MKNQAQVVVIGGGVVGASILYHLSKLGSNRGWTIELLGQSLKASLINKPLFDANANRMRS